MQSMYELNESELDLVAAGLPPVLTGGLVNVAVPINNVLTNFSIDVIDGDVTVENLLNNNTVGVAAGIAVAVLGGARGAGLLRQLPA